ncbi:three-helix bundle dimerization domain-containing protein [Gordonia terrae]
MRAHRHFDGTGARDFVPLLVERRANKTLGGTEVMADPATVPPHTGE